jgi:hypothetical protein
MGGPLYDHNDDIVELLPFQNTTTQHPDVTRISDISNLQGGSPLTKIEIKSLQQPIPNMTNEVIRVEEELDESNLYRPTLMDQIKDLVNDTNSSFGELFSPKRHQWVSPYQKIQVQESSRKQMVI